MDKTKLTNVTIDSYSITIQRNNKKWFSLGSFSVSESANS